MFDETNIPFFTQTHMRYMIYDTYSDLTPVLMQLYSPISWELFILHNSVVHSLCLMPLFSASAGNSVPLILKS